MKRIFILLVASVVVPWVVFAQSSFSFANRSIPDGIDAPVFDVDGLTALSGNGFLAQLWAAPLGQPLAPASNPATFRVDRPGYFQASTVQVDSVPFPQIAQLQVRAWRVADGATYEEAASRPGGRYGYSNVLKLMATCDPNELHIAIACFPDPLKGLQSFALIPEPSTWLLLFLGLGGLQLGKWFDSHRKTWRTEK